MSTTTNTRTTFVRFLRTRTRRVRVSPQLWQQIPFLHWPLNLEESAHTHTHGSKPSRENSWILPLMVMEPHSCIFARTLHTDLGPSKSYSRDLRLQPPPYETPTPSEPSRVPGSKFGSKTPDGRFGEDMLACNIDRLCKGTSRPCSWDVVRPC